MHQSSKVTKQQGQKRGAAFKKLRVWQEAHKFVIMIYDLSAKFPRSEMYGLTSQLRRAAVSVPANIVEGYAYQSDKRLLQYLDISKGSLAESEYFIELIKDLEYIDLKEYEVLNKQRQKIGAYLTNFAKSINN